MLQILLILLGTYYHVVSIRALILKPLICSQGIFIEQRFSLHNRDVLMHKTDLARV